MQRPELGFRSFLFTDTDPRSRNSRQSLSAERELTRRARNLGSRLPWCFDDKCHNFMENRIKEETRDILLHEGNHRPNVMNHQ